MDRRDALRRLAAVAAAPVLGIPGGAAPPGSAAGSRTTAAGRAAPADARAGGARPIIDRIGLQLYTVRTLMARDFEATLETVAAIGYREVEFAGYFDRSPAEVRGALDRAGLDAPSAHVGLDAIRGDWDRTLDAALEIGHRWLIVAWLPAGERRTLDDYRRLAEEFDRAGERARAAGLRFGYHNHDFEFVPVDGRVPYDTLVAATDPEHVAFELDLYWASRAGRDPLDCFRRHPGRFALVHVKDMDGTAAKGMTDVGDGVIDFAAILARAAEAGVRHFFVEHDRPAAPIESIRRSYAYLKRLSA
ncbi:MAG TPA: sugar phosphate isomerase/epimerase [Longimicrobiales bacterium]